MIAVQHRKDSLHREFVWSMYPNPLSDEILCQQHVCCTETNVPTWTWLWKQRAAYSASKLRHLAMWPTKKYTLFIFRLYYYTWAQSDTCLWWTTRYSSIQSRVEMRAIETSIYEEMAENGRERRRKREREREIRFGEYGWPTSDIFIMYINTTTTYTCTLHVAVMLFFFLFYFCWTRSIWTISNGRRQTTTCWLADCQPNHAD